MNNSYQSQNLKPLPIKSIKIPAITTRKLNCNMDNVDHSNHYKTGRFECIDVILETQGIEAVKDFCICNTFKYLYSHKNKNGVEDIKKAKFYLEYYIKLE